MWKIKAQLQEQQASSACVFSVTLCRSQANAQAGPRKVPEGFKQASHERLKMKDHAVRTVATARASRDLVEFPS